MIGDFRVPANAGGGTQISTALLLKTGQTTSYRTGDDGDIQAGRGSAIHTLAENNPFGNTNRFTDTAGGQTYSDLVYIDWSTFDGTNVLGYYMLNATLTHTWNQFIDWAASLSVGSWTTGWRGLNINEGFNIYDWHISDNLNYSPFSISGWTQWTSTTTPWATNKAYIFLVNSANPIIPYDKTNTRPTRFAVRTFTVTGTTLT